MGACTGYGGRYAAVLNQVDISVTQDTAYQAGRMQTTSYIAIHMQVPDSTTVELVERTGVVTAVQIGSNSVVSTIKRAAETEVYIVAIVLHHASGTDMNVYVTCKQIMLVVVVVVTN